MPHALVTGGAGFIGSHLVDSLLRDQYRVTVLDNFDPFYDRSIKLANIAEHRDSTSWRLIEGDIRDAATVNALPDDIDVIVHLAAAAGVRPSIADPVRYQEINVGRHAEPAGAGASARHPAVRVRLLEQRVRRQSERSVDRGTTTSCNRSVRMPARKSAASCSATSTRTCTASGSWRCASSPSTARGSAPTSPSTSSPG